MITIMLFDPPLARATVEMAQFPSRILDANACEGSAPAHVLVCHQHADTQLRIEQWLAQQGYRVAANYVDASKAILWQRWESHLS